MRSVSVFSWIDKWRRIARTMRVPQPVRAQIAILASIAVADILIRTADLPNPAAVTLLGVVTASFLDGIRGGVVGTVITFVYAMLWFWPVSGYTDEWRLGTILISGMAMSLLVGGLRHRFEVLLRRQVELEKENEHAAERERFVDDLRRSEERNRAFFELAGAGFAEVDAITGQFLRVNRKLAELTGYTQEELLAGRTFLDITHPDDRPLAQHQYDQAKKTGESYEAEKRYVLKSGEVKWVRTSIRAVRNDRGEPEFSAGIIIDVTETHQARQALIDANATLRRLVDSNIVGIATSRADGTIDEANDAYLSMLGYTREEFLTGRINWREITPPEFLPIDERAVAEASERGACRPYEKEYIRKDGSRVPVLVGFATVPTSKVQYIAFVIDLMQQKAAEVRERAARAEAERANRAKDEFLAVISHELRTPMTSILGWATILAAGTDPATAREGIGLLGESARLQARLIDDLLDFSRAVAGKLVIHAEELDLSALVHGAAANFRPVAAERAIRFTIDTPPEPMIVRGDQQRLHQVVWNLLSNAVKFTPREGSIEVVLQRTAGEATLRVSDSGRGISAKFLPHVFDWFAQEDLSTTREFGGLGLGLAVVRHIVRIHGGKIEAFSEGPNRGAAFVVRLPIAMGERTAEIKPAIALEE